MFVGEGSSPYQAKREAAVQAKEFLGQNEIKVKLGEKKDDLKQDLEPIDVDSEEEEIEAIDIDSKEEEIEIARDVNHYSVNSVSREVPTYIGAKPDQKSLKVTVDELDQEAKCSLCDKWFLRESISGHVSRCPVI